MLDCNGTREGKRTSMAWRVKLWIVGFDRGFAVRPLAELKINGLVKMRG
jgi:hypothetical protein